MGWLANIAARFGPSDAASNPWGWFVRHLGGTTNTGVAVSEHSALYLPIVYACINRIANPIASFPLRIYQNVGGKREEVTQHPMSERLRLRPNDYMSARTVTKSKMLHALSWGNGYQEIERNGRGEAVGLWPLLPDRTRPRRKDGAIVFDTTIDGTGFEIEHRNVLHLMDQSQDGYVGLSQVALAREAMGLALATEKFGAKFFANDAKSGGFLLHPGRLGPQAVTNLAGQKDKAAGENPASRIERQGGLDNAHRVKVLEEGMKFVSTTIPPDDAQFLSTREFQIAEIARIYDVPLVLVQSHEKSTSWGSGIEQLMIGFVRQTIAPWVEAIEQEMNWKLFTEAERAKGLYVKHSMQALLRGDMAARAAFYKSLFEVGAISPDEIAELEEMEGVGGNGAKRFVPVNFTPLDRAREPQATTQTMPRDGAQQ
ncbi:phage portal protein [Sphingosinithalassobacter portus]|uniref:phage portal protein n=1 Tax=Stakelama portus TaxID=2676234 RepID=UPI000D6E3DC5|nr:phage portal protein [Sphingosinithalassobacter portus]